MLANPDAIARITYASAFRKPNTPAVNQPEAIAHARESPKITQGLGGTVGPCGRTLAKRTSLPSICPRLVPELRPPTYFVNRKVDFGIVPNRAAHAANRCSRGPMVAETTVSRRPRPADPAGGGPRVTIGSVGGRRAPSDPGRGPTGGTSAFPK